MPTKLLTYYESHNKCDDKEKIKRNIKVLKKNLGGWNWFKGVIANLFRKSGLSKIKIEESLKENEQMESSQWQILGDAYQIRTPDKNLTMVGREEEDRFEFKADVKVEESGLEENKANFVMPATIRAVREFLDKNPDNESIQAMMDFRAIDRGEENIRFNVNDCKALLALLRANKGVFGFSDEEENKLAQELTTVIRNINDTGYISKHIQVLLEMPQMHNLTDILYLANSNLKF